MPKEMPMPFATSCDHSGGGGEFPCVVCGCFRSAPGTRVRGAIAHGHVAPPTRDADLVVCLAARRRCKVAEHIAQATAATRSAAITISACRRMGE